MTKLILGTAVGTVLAGLILQHFGLLPRVVSWLWGGASWLVGTLVSSQQIPGWVILVLVLLGLSGVIIIGMAVIVILRRKKKQPAQHPFATYTKDLVDGIKWRWNWQGGTIVNLIPIACDPAI